jgi:hypothetical protein
MLQRMAPSWLDQFWFAQIMRPSEVRHRPSRTQNDPHRELDPELSSQCLETPRVSISRAVMAAKMSLLKVARRVHGRPSCQAGHCSSTFTGQHLISTDILCARCPPPQSVVALRVERRMQVGQAELQANSAWSKLYASLRLSQMGWQSC